MMRLSTLVASSSISQSPVFRHRLHRGFGGFCHAVLDIIIPFLSVLARLSSNPY
ncbi:uncharacterized protein BDV14DRAFT_175388 [Aspergillus stella-maris]|uniref:uncharacterized protein n=1 Tax=Aspergillus stella-maris TaxID=1810926 RepID=UPI003CCD614C